VELILCYKRRGKRNEVRVSFYQDKCSVLHSTEPRFAFARIVPQAGRYEKSVAESETKQERKKVS
jgi:hypothetical protein